MRFGSTLLGLAATIALLGAQAHAAPRDESARDLARRAMSGDAAAPGAVESLLEPLFARKDLWALDERSGAREALRLLGEESSPAAARWIRFSGDSAGLRLLIVDFGLMVGSSGASGPGYVAYGIVEDAGSSGPRVSWYHDLGRKISEQKGSSWHPVAVRLLPKAEGSGAGGRVMVVEASSSSGPYASGLILLEEKGADWTAAGRIAPPGEARLMGVGPEGAVFIAPREPPKGVLTGAPAGTFRALLLYDRSGGSFATEPILAPVPDVVSATETVIATVRRGDKDEARRLCVSPDVIDAMLYFSPGWLGGGRIVRADAKTLEVVYEERDRPTLRIEFAYQNRGGVLLLSSVTGKAEEKKP